MARKQKTPTEPNEALLWFIATLIKMPDLKREQEIKWYGESNGREAEGRLRRWIDREIVHEPS
ncbi:hypothetical protein [Robbsia andropogonis]|uniref:hypothetical protein n=1 Tax=Robbsia andropogonis TaxID=28092 RepID=UPI00209F096A|nr:hypothetical protein [Robbsia andropogonis]MCP1121549.1 hypothetical protein [Robbsia andropogonis]